MPTQAPQCEHDVGSKLPIPRLLIGERSCDFQTLPIGSKSTAKIAARAERLAELN